MNHNKVLEWEHMSVHRRWQSRKWGFCILPLLRWRLFPPSIRFWSVGGRVGKKRQRWPETKISYLCICPLFSLMFLPFLLLTTAPPLAQFSLPPTAINLPPPHFYIFPSPFSLSHPVFESQPTWVGTVLIADRHTPKS